MKLWFYFHLVAIQRQSVFFSISFIIDLNNRFGAIYKRISEGNFCIWFNHRSIQKHIKHLLGFLQK